MRGALDVIATQDPRRLARMRKDVRRIFVAGIEGRGQYIAELDMCVLDYEILEQGEISPARLAMVIVHEATHARLERAGVGYPVALRDRIERACVAAEIAFARTLPEPEALVADAARRLDRPAGFWSDESFQQRKLEALRELGTPAWIVRWLAR